MGMGVICELTFTALSAFPLIRGLYGDVYYQVIQCKGMGAIMSCFVEFERINDTELI